MAGKKCYLGWWTQSAFFPPILPRGTRGISWIQKMLGEQSWNLRSNIACNEGFGGDDPSGGDNNHGNSINCGETPNSVQQNMKTKDTCSMQGIYWGKSPGFWDSQRQPFGTCFAVSHRYLPSRKHWQAEASFEEIGTASWWISAWLGCSRRGLASAAVKICKRFATQYLWCNIGLMNNSQPALW